MIVSRNNEKIKDMRQVRRCKDDRGLLEGPHLVEAAIEAGLRLETVVATDRFLATGHARRLMQLLPRPPLVVAPEVLDEICDSDSPRGIAAAALLPARRLPSMLDGIVIYADGIQDPGNLGALARSGEAAGASALVLAAGCAHPNHPRALRASAGSLLRLPTARSETADAIAAAFLPARPEWIGLAADGALDLYEYTPSERLVLVVGSEAHGISAATRKRLDATLYIPLSGAVESLNATVAASLALFEIRRRRRLV